MWRVVLLGKALFGVAVVACLLAEFNTPALPAPTLHHLRVHPSVHRPDPTAGPQPLPVAAWLFGVAGKGFAIVQRVV